MKKIGFIGMGNMATALLKGLTKGGKVDKVNVYAYAPNQDKLKKNAEEIGFVPCASLKEVANTADILVMACKPYQVEAVIGEIKEDLRGKSLVSVASGWDFEKYHNLLGDEVGIQYIMPNLPVEIREGIILVEEKNNFSDDVRNEIMEMLSTCALVEEVPLEHFDAATAISGCGPAFIAMVIEALGDGGVKNGLKREEAYRLACQTMVGTAKQLLETGEHPAKLKDAVCSPGGTTIKGVASLEKSGMRSAFIEAIDIISK